MRATLRNFFNLDDCINANYNDKSLPSRIVSQLNSNKNKKIFVSSTQVNFVLITFGELNPKDEICEHNSENMSVLQNDVHSPQRYVKISMDTGGSVSFVHDSFVRQE